ncbi:MAG: tRNA (adenine-N1)-methyltransferase [Acidobacteria bacterium]|nr:tRNA (adenine-N1)-methyltransferase [Acidobacteriota bacterium]MBI3656129.1 tRNA (adenine-N1)-methyltransferase [Acidobacteriota bacterium]
MEEINEVSQVKAALNYGNSVLLYSLQGKTFLIRLDENAKFHCHLGVIPHKEIIGLPYGGLIYTQTGNPFYLLEPTTEDFIMKSARKTAIMYPKDIGLLLLKAGVRAGAQVIEMGSGSGGLAMALANAVGPSGRVFSYDKSPSFQVNAGKNVARAGFHNLVEYKVRYVTEGFDEKDVDVVVMDIPIPWEGIEHAWTALKGGGRFASFVPTYNQVERTAEALKKSRFVNVECVEILHRYILAREGKTRPFADMIGHTGFLLFARKVLIAAPAEVITETKPDTTTVEDEGLLPL